MTDKFFTQKATLLRMADGVLGPHLAAVAKTLDEEQYSTATIRRHLRAVDQFGAWLKERAIPVADVSETTVGSYIQGLSRRRSKSRSSGHLSQFALGLYRLVDILRQAGAAVDRWSVSSHKTSQLTVRDRTNSSRQAVKSSAVLSPHQEEGEAFAMVSFYSLASATRNASVVISPPIRRTPNKDCPR